MRLIIAGSRSIQDMTTVRAAILWSGWEPWVQEIISGMAYGIDPTTRKPVKSVDTLAVEWAESKGLPVIRMHARWKVYGEGAGFIRNEDMARYAANNPPGALLAIWDGKSNGTHDMIWKAKDAGLTVKVYSEHGL